MTGDGTTAGPRLAALLGEAATIAMVTGALEAWRNSDAILTPDIVAVILLGAIENLPDGLRVLNTRAPTPPADSTPGPIERPWLTGQLERVYRIQALKENWDSYHSPPMTAQAADVTRSLLHMLSAWHTINPKIQPQLCPTTDGGIQIVWREQGYELDVDIEPDGQVTGWLHRLCDGAEVTWPPEDAADPARHA